MTQRSARDIEGAAGVVTLNRPRALNALTTAMRAEIAAAFAAWARDPQVYAAVIVSATDRAFCAGGDVREMVEWGKERPDDARRSLAAEYALNWQLDCFTKPTVSLIDGMVMGSGVGITLYGTHRVAGERYRFAMPETGIGLFPDDGVSWAFARMPDEIGMYLALTGRAIGRADAFRLGLVTHCIPAARFAEVIGAALSDADPVDPVLDGRHEDPGPGRDRDVAAGHCPLLRQGQRGSHRRARSRRSAASARAGPRECCRICSAARRPRSRSPTGTYGPCASCDLSATLKQDFRLASRFMQGHDFYEGVRAGLIDRDHAPSGNPASLEDVSEAVVDAYFAPLGPDELQLATPRRNAGGPTLTVPSWDAAICCVNRLI